MPNSNDSASAGAKPASISNDDISPSIQQNIATKDDIDTLNSKFECLLRVVFDVKCNDCRVKMKNSFSQLDSLMHNNLKCGNLNTEMSGGTDQNQPKSGKLHGQTHSTTDVVQTKNCTTEKVQMYDAARDLVGWGCVKACLAFLAARDILVD